MKKRKRRDKMIRRMARKNARLRRVLIRIAYYDLEDRDPLAICAVRQWAKEELDKAGRK